MIAVDADDTELELSGKAGLSAPISEKLDAYAELSFLTGEIDTGYGVKAVSLTLFDSN